MKAVNISTRFETPRHPRWQTVRVPTREKSRFSSGRATGRILHLATLLALAILTPTGASAQLQVTMTELGLPGSAVSS